MLKVFWGHAYVFVGMLPDLFARRLEQQSKVESDERTRLDFHFVVPRCPLVRSFSVTPIERVPGTEVEGTIFTDIPANAGD